MTQEEVEEWEDNGRKFRAPKASLRIAFQREGAINNKQRELTDRERRIEAADREREEHEALLEKGDLDKLLTGRFKGDKIDLFSRGLKAELEREKRMADPAQRELLTRAEEADSLRAENQRYKQAEARQKLDAEVGRRLKAVSDRYMPALEKLNLPKNDITLALMRGEDRVNRGLGLNLSPEQLAESTKGAVAQLVEGLTENMTPVQAVEAFPTLARLIHKGLIERESTRRDPTRAQVVKNTKKAAAVNGEQKNGEGSEEGKPRVMNHAEIQKATGLWGL